jgi:hypothetical protein
MSFVVDARFVYVSYHYCQTIRDGDKYTLSIHDKLTGEEHWRLETQPASVIVPDPENPHLVYEFQKWGRRVLDTSTKTVVHNEIMGSPPEEGGDPEDARWTAGDTVARGVIHGSYLYLARNNPASITVYSKGAMEKVADLPVEEGGKVWGLHALSDRLIAMVKPNEDRELPIQHMHLCVYKAATHAH